MSEVDRDDEASLVSPELGETRLGRWRVSTAALRAYSMVFALVVIWIFFQWRTVSDLYPYGLFLHPVNLANLLHVSGGQGFAFDGDFLGGNV